MMKKITLFILALISLSFLITACSSDDNGSAGGITADDAGVKATMPDIELEELTRSTFAFTGSKMKFSWVINDCIGVFPVYDQGSEEQEIESADDSPQRELYCYQTVQNANSMTGYFSTGVENEDGKIVSDGKSYVLSENGTSKYVAYRPCNVTHEKGYTVLPITYLNQTQKCNVKFGKYSSATNADNTEYLESEAEACEHVGNYDYLASTATQQSNGATSFDFSHLQGTVRFYLVAPDQDDYDIVYDRIQLINKDKKFTVKGDLNLGTQKVTPTETSNVVSLKLGEDGFKFTEGDGDYKSSAYGNLIIAYMQVFPIDLTGGDVAKSILYLIGHKGKGDDMVQKVYKKQLSKKNIEAGNLYQWSFRVDSDEPIKLVECMIQEWEKDTKGFTNSSSSDADNVDTGKGTEGW